jgi:predicted peptidase
MPEPGNSQSNGGLTTPSLPQGPGVHPITLQPSGRRVTIAIPANVYPGKPAPLILALHWGGPRYPFIGQAILETLIQPALEPLGAIIAAPDCNAEHWATLQSEAEVLELLDLLQAAYPLDPSRTLLVGYSLGGIGTWYLAGRHPDRFRSAIVISARPVPEVKACQWKIPLLVLHSRQDEIFPLRDTQRVVEHLQAKGAPVSLHILEGITHFETQRFVQPLRETIPWILQNWT